MFVVFFNFYLLIIIFFFKGFIISIVLIGLQMCVKYRQRYNRKFYGVSEPQHSIIFTDVDPIKFDENIISFFKCILNYGFYKFGFEVIF